MDVVNSTDANYKNNWGETYNSSNPSMSIEAYKNIVPDFFFPLENMDIFLLIF